jgi:hypothetical protein
VFFYAIQLAYALMTEDSITVMSSSLLQICSTPIHLPALIWIMLSDYFTGYINKQKRMLLASSFVYQRININGVIPLRLVSLERFAERNLHHVPVCCNHKATCILQVSHQASYHAYAQQEQSTQVL